MYVMQQYTPEGCSEGHMAAISKVDGGYIGLMDFAASLEDRGIAAQCINSSHSVCSIGFNLHEKKWYGWSHRALFGFGIGSKVEKGDCGYVAVDWADLIDDAIRFWSEPEYKENITACLAKDDEGRACVLVEWDYTDNVPNKKLHGTRGNSYMYPPENWGRGEWEAKTLDDAKQMAIDFANGVG